MKIVHFSDPHGGGPAEEWRAYFDKRWVGVFNYRFRRRFRHDLSKLQKAVEYILNTAPDVAVCTGDLTSAGQPGEFSRVCEILQPLRDSNIPLIYLPGNHDCYVKRPNCVAAMKEAVKYLSRDSYRFEDLPLTVRYGNAEFILVNTSRPSNLLCSWGFLAKKDSSYIEKICKTPHETPRILVAHYPMTDDHPVLRIRHRLFGQKRVQELMSAKEIDLVLCGHIHRPYLKIDDTGRGECCSGSVTRNGTIREIIYNKGNFIYKTIEL